MREKHHWLTILLAHCARVIWSFEKYVLFSISDDLWEIVDKVLLIARTVPIGRIVKIKSAQHF
jgi:hypothetical protein